MKKIRNDLILIALALWGAVLILLAFAIDASSQGQSVSLQWENDRQAFIYNVGIGFSPGSYPITNRVWRQPGPRTAIVVSNLQASTRYHFAVQSVPLPIPYAIPPGPSGYSPEIVVTTSPPVIVVTAFESCDARGPWEPITNFYFRGTSDGRFFQTKLRVIE